MTGGPPTRARQILDAARRLLEAEGAAALSMRRLAEALGIRAPSIYRHFPDKRALENALISTAFEQMAAILEAAVAGADDPIEAIGAGYRGFARAPAPVPARHGARPRP